MSTNSQNKIIQYINSNRFYATDWKTYTETVLPNVTMNLSLNVEDSLEQFKQNTPDLLVIDMALANDAPDQFTEPEDNQLMRGYFLWKDLYLKNTPNMPRTILMYTDKKALFTQMEEDAHLIVSAKALGQLYINDFKLVTLDTFITKITDILKL
jgi:hypothetical protein